MALVSLPKDLQRLVLIVLPLEDLYAFICTCKRLSQWLKDDTLWYDRCVYHFPEEVIKKECADPFACYRFLHCLTELKGLMQEVEDLYSLPELEENKVIDCYTSSLEHEEIEEKKALCLLL